MTELTTSKLGGQQRNKMKIMPDQRSKAPNTTHQEDIVTAGQRRINLVWEFTQAVIAILITGAVVYCQIHRIEAQILSNAFFLIISMYFIRTNHKLIGGVGDKTGTR